MNEEKYEVLLPPLPEAWITDCTTTDPAARLHFAADQMREYGQACAEAALAKVYAIAVEEKAKMDAEPARQPAPVLSDERIDWLANCACPGGTAYPSQVKAAIRDALREAAATRSQA